MKNTFLNPLSVVAVASFSLFGCASSSETSNSTAWNSEMNRSETSAAGGFATDANDNQLNVLVLENQLMLPVATVSVTALAMENTVPVDEMFEDIKDTESYDVLSLVKSSPNLSTFAMLLENSHLMNQLKNVNELTLFAPTNAAFAKMTRQQLEDLLKPENSAYLSQVLQAHILTSEVSSAVLADNNRIRVSDETYIPIETDQYDRGARIGGAMIVKGDVEASNGRIHVIDKVIIPSEDFRED